MFSGIGQPSQYVISSISLILNDFTTIELKPVMIELSIFEDIFSPAASGYVLITDAQGFIQIFNITGFNFIRIEFAKSNVNDDPEVFSRLYRVYKIGERHQLSRTNEQYAIHFCSEEVFLSEQIRVARSYSNSKISDMIGSILIDYLNVDEAKIVKIEETIGQYTFVVPNLKPMEAISWLSTYSQPAESNYVGADMLFFENRDGFNFRSIQSLISEGKDDPYKKHFNFSPQNLSQEPSIEYNKRAIISYSFKETFDTLKAVSSGVFANKLVSIDPLLRTTKITKFDYEKYFDESVSLNDQKLTTGYVNRLGKKVNEMYDSVFKVLATNQNQKTFDAVVKNENMLNSVAPSIGLEVYIPNRTAQLPLINYHKIEFVTPGDPGLSVGEVVDISIPAMGPAENNSLPNLDIYHSGNYLVSAVRHKMDIRGVYHCVVEAIKDSVLTENYPAVADTAALEVSQA